LNVSSTISSKHGIIERWHTIVEVSKRGHLRWILWHFEPTSTEVLNNELTVALSQPKSLGVHIIGMLAHLKETLEELGSPLLGLHRAGARGHQGVMTALVGGLRGTCNWAHRWNLMSVTTKRQVKKCMPLTTLVQRSGRNSHTKQTLDIGNILG
jgi:hypothetical protein